jgi:hypothetical protein
MVLAIGHALRTHEALSRPDALSGFLEVIHRLFEDGVFVGHDKSIRTSILRSLVVCLLMREGRVRAQEEREAGGVVTSEEPFGFPFML